jgi:hypothetical protein
MLSCIQQQVLGTLNEAGGVRMWLSNGAVSRSPSNNKGQGLSANREKLQTSVASLLLLRLPNALLLWGVACFLVGFGLFLGFAWRQDLDNTPSRDSNLAVMIMYITVGSVSFLGAAGVVKWKMGEVGEAEKVVGKDIEEGDDEEDEDESIRQNDDRDSEGEGDSLLAKSRRNGGYPSMEEADHHRRIAKALEDAARAHRELARLMSDAVPERR